MSQKRHNQLSDFLWGGIQESNLSGIQVPEGLTENTGHQFDERKIDGSSVQA